MLRIVGLIKNTLSLLSTVAVSVQHVLARQVIAGKVQHVALYDRGVGIEPAQK